MIINGVFVIKCKNEPISVMYSAVVSNYKWGVWQEPCSILWETLSNQVRMFQYRSNTEAHTLTHICVWVCVRMVSKAVCVCMPCVSRVGESHLQLQMSGVASRAPMWACNHAALSLDEARAAELKASGSHRGSLCDSSCWFWHYLHNNSSLAWGGKRGSC